MEEKRIHLNQSVYELCNMYPELPEILVGLGFQDITKPGMLSTVGRFMTLSKGSAMKKIDLNLIKNTLSEHGFHVE